MYCAKGVPQLNDNESANAEITHSLTRKQPVGAIGNIYPWIFVEDCAIVESPAIIIFADAGAKTVAATAVRTIEPTFIAKYIFVYSAVASGWL